MTEPHPGSVSSPRSRPPSGSLLRARTSVPMPSPRTVRRGRLLEQLDQGARGGVTLVSAGPGCGKTQLVSDWASTRDGRVAWLALGPDCNDPQRFWTLLLAALQRAGAATDALAALRPPPEVDDTFVDLVLTVLDELGEPVVLVLEDLHEVRSPATLRRLDLLVQTRPDQLHLVLLTRADPPLALHRLRVSGELVEIRPAALAFTADEARELFAQDDLLLTPDEIVTLLCRTEGWAAGLRLAALSILDRPDAAQRAAAIARFSGDDRGVADYLMGEVLERQPADLRRFLLRTSVVERIDASLADALTGGQDGAASLDALERSGALLVALDPGQGWYRYHRLFLEMCRHRLTVEVPGEAAGLHVRASHWFAGHGEPTEAVRHALAAGDWTLLSRTAVRHAGALVFGHQGRELQELLTSIPADADPDDPWLACARALGWHDGGDGCEFVRHLERGEQTLDHAAPGERQLLRLVLSLLRAADSRAGCDVDAAATHSALALELAESQSPVDVPALAGYVAVGHLLRGKSLVWLGELRLAESHLRAAGAAGAEGVDSPVLARAYLSLVLARQGRIGEAVVEAEDAMAMAAQAGWADDFQSTSAYLALVLVHLHRGDRPPCYAALDQAALVLRRRPDRLLELSWRVAEVLLLSEDTEHRRATEAVQELWGLVDELPSVVFLRSWLTLVEAEVNLAAGRPDQVAADLDAKLGTEPGATLGPASALSGSERVVRGRCAVARNQPLAALDLVEPLLSTASTDLTTVEAWLIAAEAEVALRRDAAALSAVGRALDGAETDTLLRPFCVAHPRLHPLLHRHRSAVGTHSANVDRLLRRLPDHAAPPAPKDARLEPLTDRELSVLQLLPTMMSNAEIAAELSVSVNTVKVHLKSLYRKLGVASRREAVREGRDLIEAPALLP